MTFRILPLSLSNYADMIGLDHTLAFSTFAFCFIYTDILEFQLFHDKTQNMSCIDDEFLLIKISRNIRRRDQLRIYAL